MLACRSLIHAPATSATHQALVGASDKGLRDSSSSGGEIRAQARFLRHPKPRKALKSESVCKITYARRGVFKT